jgi:transcriptional regulator with XRE-family HTH domain
MARAALNWSANDLAKASKLGYATVARFESGHNLAVGSVSAMQAALEAEGIAFNSKGVRISVSAPR